MARNERGGPLLIEQERKRDRVKGRERECECECVCVAATAIFCTSFFSEEKFKFENIF